MAYPLVSVLRMVFRLVTVLMAYVTSDRLTMVARVPSMISLTAKITRVSLPYFIGVRVAHVTLLGFVGDLVPLVIIVITLTLRCLPTIPSAAFIPALLVVAGAARSGTLARRGRALLLVSRRCSLMVCLAASSYCT